MDETEGLTNVMLFETVSKNKQQNAAINKKRRLGAVDDSQEMNVDDGAVPKEVVRTKPQSLFRQMLDNSTARHWSPVLLDKPHAISPLSHTAQLSWTDAYTGILHVPHFYETELRQLQFPSSNKLSAADGSWSRIIPLEKSRLVMVKKYVHMLDMLTELKNEKTIAVDLEHHSYRSFLGFTCLIQISTPGGVDYIIDTLDPTIRAKASMLNAVFANPRILKLFHGADSDILWLQRDFNIYVVNMFDTHQAAKVLALPSKSLAALLTQFLHIELDKKFQTADWRIRPLRTSMITYARKDTHYMFALTAKLVKKLAATTVAADGASTTPLRIVLEQSRKLCLQTYRKPAIMTTAQFKQSLETFAIRDEKFFTIKQRDALWQMFLWRDKIARAEDESPGYILGKNLMFKLVEAFPLTRDDVEKVLLNSRQEISSALRSRIDELVLVFREANAIVESTADVVALAEKNNEAEEKSFLDDDDEKMADDDLQAENDPATFSLTFSVRDCSQLFGTAPHSVPKKPKLQRNLYAAGRIIHQVVPPGRSDVVGPNLNDAAVLLVLESAHCSSVSAIIENVFHLMHETD